VVLSRHGAGIISTYRLALDEILTLRLNGDGKEAEVRLVGPLGEERSGYAYGVAFLDPDVDFRKMEFPPPSQGPMSVEGALGCNLCHTQQVVDQSEIEGDVYVIAQTILRFCPDRGRSTAWRRAAKRWLHGIARRAVVSHHQPPAGRSNKNWLNGLHLVT
jgi:hypothetical protein